MPIVGSSGLTIREPPDAERIVCDYLREALQGAAEVGLTLPSDENIRNHLPFVRVTRFAGRGNLPERFDYPLLDIDVWHASNELVNRFGGIVRAVLAELNVPHLRYLHAQQRAEITRSVEVAGGPQRLADEDPDIKWFHFSVELTVRQL